ncbi:MAG TPA: ADP-ribosylglycohydrolase family protein [Tepidisphaeraceae bacterium]|nr:ADP-ribosylglycohydrolase family protein [Tepidisphaeraceae bacterium]
MGLPTDYLQRVYAGVLGKIIGVYLGRPFEGWSFEKIMAELGEITWYVHERRGVPLIVVDDDISGTFAFIRALEDHPGGFGITAEQVGKTWLNYLVENRLVLWWGGLGVSTEHTAYLRLKAGIPAPQSGSIALNGKLVAEQIGAQIFIDSWAMVCPGDPARAAALAKQAASVSHDGEAVFAAQLLAAMESAAFVESDLHKLLDVGLTFIPHDCLIAKMIGELRQLRKADPDWHAARKLLVEKWGYDKYGGGCHMIPNHGVVIMALLWGNDDFQRSLMIANTAGWDTDCNSGNVGCFLGIKNGLKGIDAGPDFRGPVADRMYVSTADGARGITDAAAQAVWLTNIGRSLLGEKPIAPKDGARFHFDLPGSRQGWMPDPSPDAFPGLKLENVAGHSELGSRSLAMHYHGLAPGQSARAVMQTGLLGDPGKAGYALVASPTLHCGQTVRCAIWADSANAHPVIARLAIFTWTDGDRPLRIPGPPAALAPGEKRTLQWTVHTPPGQPISQLAVELSSDHPASGAAYLDLVTWSGTPDLALGVPEAKDSTAWRRAWVDGVDTTNWGNRRGSDEEFVLTQNHGRGLLVYGGREWGPHRVTATVRSPLAKNFGIAAHVNGMRRYYALLLDGKFARLIKMRDEQTVLAERAYPTECRQPVKLSIAVDGSRICASIDEKQVFDMIDANDPLTTGGIALMCEEGRMISGAVRVESAALQR